jgi:tetratricopeptide (TPR) repeat protein
VYERLLELDPDTEENVHQLARAMTECGQAEDAVQLLLRFAKTLTAAEDYAGTSAAYAEILAIDPMHEGATAMVRQIDDGRLAARRRERREAVQRFLLGMVVLALGIWLYFESLAKQEMAEAERLISQYQLIELRQYDEVIGILEFARRRYPYSTTSLLDLPARIAILEESRARALEAVTETPPAR